jgi:solute carrier family 25 citrate transporter 1
MKQSANSATRFTSYEFMKDFLKARSSTGQVTNTQTVLIGSAAGVITVCEYDNSGKISQMTDS